MPAPNYFVTAVPGIPVPRLGLVQPGVVFEAPEGFVPSPTLRAMNEEAAAELDKVFAGVEAELEKRLERRRDLGSPADCLALEEQLKDLRRRHALAKEVLTEEQAGALRTALSAGK